MYESTDCVANAYIIRDRNSKLSNNIPLVHKIKVGSYYVVLLAKSHTMQTRVRILLKWDTYCMMGVMTHTADWMVTYSEGAGGDVILVQWIRASSEEYFDTIK